ncbi:molybdenum cofactor guanylyltransferase MobA [Oceanospirillum sanctuarii]|uniref:molybdenum cofactor guanylyltransferase MobA n=1 Tax=Oceanospirillum sanctuarii TaxID=1434821 RepID=UPI001C3D4A52|nr:molybdenum cofactor guanylyltransferase MobA [Oceanospirillum sanctuarii]
MSDLNIGILSGVPQPMTKQSILSDTREITAVVLAGGQGQRMGGMDKGWVNFQGRPMIHHVLEQISPQVQSVLINANRSLEEYQALGHQVVEDIEQGYHGPLMGMLTGLTHAKTDWVLFVPCDIPLLPKDVVEKLNEAVAKNDVDVAVVHDGERLQPVISLMRRSLLPSLESWLAEGKRKIDRWYMQHRMVVVPFDSPEEDFMNLNTQQEVQELEQRL